MKNNKIIKNTLMGLVSVFIPMILAFLTRKLFIDFIGVEIIGINSLFKSVLDALNLTELGFSSVIVFKLYKAIAEKNEIEINKSIKILKSVYLLIALLIFVVGIIIMFFLDEFVTTSYSLIFLRICYFIQLMATVSTYLFSYKKCLLQADQRSYLINLNATIINVLFSVIRIIIIVIYNNYILYILTTLVQNILENICITIICKYKYPFLNNKIKVKKQDYLEIMLISKDAFINKFSLYINDSTDNFVISKFINITTVGIYSNYLLIVYYLKTFITQVLYAITPAFGNAVHTLGDNNIESIYSIFKKIDFLCYLIGSFVFIALTTLFNPFIEYAFDKTLVLSDFTAFLLALDFYIVIIMNPTWQLYEIYGLFRIDKWITLMAATLNIILSIILVRFFGLNGVIFGTICSHLILWLYRSYWILHNKLKQSFLRYIGIEFKYMVISFSVLFFFLLIKKIYVINSFFDFVFMGIGITVVFFVINLLFFYKSSEALYLYNSLKTNLKGKK